jgi:transcriptional regulator of nitric oxide reductase
MASPTVTAGLDRASYALGALMTLTVTYGDTDRQSMIVTVTVTDAEGNSSAPVSLPVVIDPLAIAVTSVPSRAWTKVSDTGAVAVFTATA